MKLTKSKLKQLIKEELQNILLNEDDEKRTQYLCIDWFDDDLDVKEKARIKRAFRSSNPGRTSTNSWNNYLSKWEDCPHSRQK